MSLWHIKSGPVLLEVCPSPVKQRVGFLSKLCSLLWRRRCDFSLLGAVRKKSGKPHSCQICSDWTPLALTFHPKMWSLTVPLQTPGCFLQIPAVDGALSVHRRDNFSMRLCACLCGCWVFHLLEARVSGSRLCLLLKWTKQTKWHSWRSHRAVYRTMAH